MIEIGVLVGLVVVVAWYVTWISSEVLGMGMMGVGFALGAPELAAFYALLVVMMVAMMLPSALPMILAYRGITRLEAGRPIRDLGLDVDEAKAIRGFRFLTEKPVLVLLNIGEREIPSAEESVEVIRAAYPHRHALVDALSARIEMELGELEPDDAAVFMTELGIERSGLGRVIALSYQLLGLISFLTAGPDEVRAWPIPDGSTAVDAAGAIHTDLAKGFIRAETVAYEDLLALRSMAEARKAGRLRSEGRTYHVRDGDVLEILFSR